MGHQILKRNTQFLSYLLVLLVFGGAIWVAKEQLSQRISDQVLTRQAEVLQAIALVHQVSVIESSNELSIENPGDQLVVMEELYELSGALGFRLYSPQSDYLYSFPETITEGTLNQTKLERTKSLRSSAAIHENTNLSDWIITGEENISQAFFPILEVILPLHVAEEDDLMGIAQLIFDGHDTLADISKLKQQINTQSMFVFASGAGLIALVLGISFRSLNRSHDRLTNRTIALNEANQALALSSKTTAIGGIASHLMHGLRNPLATLKTQLGNSSENTLNKNGHEAISRMEELIEDVLRTLRDHQGGIVYQITTKELLGVFENKFSPVAKKHSVNLYVDVTHNHELDNREASLILLIIENLSQNAIEACSGSGKLMIRSTKNEVIEISDNGRGLPEGTKARLFKPGGSSKHLGSGLGLAISRQLAMSIDAELRLAKSDEQGTTFELRLAKRTV